MKKLLALLLALAMVFALAACGSSSNGDPDQDTDTDSQGTTESENSESEGSGPAGSEEPGTVDLTGKKAALIVPISSVEALNQICENFVSYMAEYGVDAVYSSCEGDNTMAMTLIENYAADKYDIIIVIPLDETGLEDSITAARAKGSLVALLSTQPAYEVDGGLTADMEACGYAVADMATYWVEQTFPDAAEDSIGVAVVASETPENYKLCKEAMVNTMNEGAATYVAYKSGDEDGGSIEKGFSFAENALTADPNIRVFVTQEAEAAKGISNYLITRTDLDLNEFAVFSINSDETAIEMVQQSADPSVSVLRGLIPYGSDDTGRVAADIAYGLLSGEQEAPYWIYDELHTVNTFDWTLDMAPTH